MCHSTISWGHYALWAVSGCLLANFIFILSAVGQRIVEQSSRYMSHIAGLHHVSTACDPKRNSEPTPLHLRHPLSLALTRKHHHHHHHHDKTHANHYDRLPGRSKSYASPLEGPQLKG